MSAATEGLVISTFSDDVATLTLNRPAKLNAVIPELVDELCTALEGAIRTGVGALVLAGAGRSFCSGHDLEANSPADDLGQLRAQLERIQDVTRLVRAAPFPVISKVHGYALGAGCEFALCSDLVVAARDAEFGFPEVGVGLSITGGISRLLPTAVGLVTAKELVLLGERFGAPRAKELGLVNLVVERNELDDAVWRWATALAARPRLAMRLAKAALDNGVGELDSAFETEIGHAMVTQVSPGARQAAAGFVGRDRG
ncbi:enoyl-CoA hydratase/isomerase family protein [Amycolatopsis taiwanensis]|uniref:Enoyl-CoA hydratase n=1 Tax=Amycolatopsis taiwanensis TaxID=342230 RepID=A0A9W6R9X9_9PSEU|nr:enoyl-CoA hydratase/isomerase family protein [Amycolatopsis taiwanensis]GLY70247.1 enoyl-CoA hydratase [Amycolatopsis taiwanensis]